MIRLKQLQNNQIEVMTNDEIYFFSYETHIATISDGQVYFTKSWDYSATTMKYLNQFLRDNGFEHIAKKTEKQKEKYIQDNDLLI